MSAPTRDNVQPLDRLRARRLLQDMVDNPFAVIIYRDGVPEGITKGLSDEEHASIEALLDLLS